MGSFPEGKISPGLYQPWPNRARAAAGPLDSSASIAGPRRCRFVEYRDAGGSLAQAIIANGVIASEADTPANLFMIELAEGGGSGDDTNEVPFRRAPRFRQ